MRLPVTAGHRPFLLRGHDLPAFTQPTPMEGVLEQFRSVSLELAGKTAPEAGICSRRIGVHSGVASFTKDLPQPAIDQRRGGNRDRRVGG